MAPTQPASLATTPTLLIRSSITSNFAEVPERRGSTQRSIPRSRTSRTMRWTRGAHKSELYFVLFDLLRFSIHIKFKAPKTEICRRFKQMNCAPNLICLSVRQHYAAPAEDFLDHIPQAESAKIAARLTADFRRSSAGSARRPQCKVHSWSARSFVPARLLV